MKQKTMWARSLWMSLLLGWLVCGYPAHAEEDVFQVLLDKARYLQARGRPDQSAEAWRKVLAASPDHKEAMLWLGISEAHAGNAAKAKEYAARLHDAAASKAELRALERAIVMGAPDPDRLRNARGLAESHQPVEAVAEYKKAFRGVDPTDYLALEYYQVMAAAPDGWGTAKSGLEELAKEFPDQTLFKYAVAKHLSYRENTRREAIASLDTFLGDKAVGEDAEKNLRQALEWLQVRPGDEALLEKYARKWPDDRAILKKRKELHWQVHGPDDRDLALKLAYEQLDAGEADKAEATLRPFVKDNKQADGEIAAAMGLARLKQGRFEESVSEMERAITQEPDNENAGKWRETLRTAKYWSLLRRAETLKQENKLAEAEQALREAIDLRPAEALPRNALADTLAKLGRPAKAREVYEDVLKRDPGNVDARSGLVFVLADLGEREKALKLANELTLQHPEKGVAFAQIQAREFAGQALIATDADVRARAMMKLQGMLSADPANPWIRLDLARVYRAQGKIDEARSLLDGLLVSHPDMPAALYARALLHEQEGEHAQALAALERVPEAARNADMRKLQNRLWVNLQAQRASAFAAQGWKEKARGILEQVAPLAANDPEFTGLLANAWHNIGDNERALALLRRGKQDDLDLKFLYLGILLETGQDAEVELVMKELEKRELTPAQRKSLDDVLIGYSVRQADEARARGDYARAYEYLAPLREKYPGNDAVVVALASLHAAVNDDTEAFSYYTDVLRRNPKDIAALSGVVGLAMKNGDHRLARQLAEGGLRESPDNAQAHALAGRVAHAMGDDPAAVAHFEKALDLEEAVLDDASPIQKVLGVEYERAPLKKSDSALDEEYGGDSSSGPLSGIARELADIKAAHSGGFKAGLVLRHRDGDEGLNKLDDIEMPLEYSLSPGYGGRVTFGIVPVLLDASALRMKDAKRFGTYMLNTAAIPASLQQDDEGVAVNVAFDSARWHLDAGVTPLGFTESNVVGGLRWRPTVKEMKTSIGVNRRAVTQSLLSYAGARDPLTGKTWGGVTENALDFSGSYDLGGSGVYGSLSYAGLEGTNVVRNAKVQLGAGFYKNLYQTARDKVTAGLHVNAFGFQKNLGQFSFGHGGYFSPRRYLSLTAPVNWTGYDADMRYGLGGSIGVQSFAEDDADYFPGDRAMQAQLETLAALDPALSVSYKGNDEIGLTYGLHGELEYSLSARLAVGARLDLANSENYNEFAALVYAVYWAEPQRDLTLPDPARPFYRGMNHD